MVLANAKQGMGHGPHLVRASNSLAKLAARCWTPDATLEQTELPSPPLTGLTQELRY